MRKNQTLKEGFEVLPAENGGWVIFERPFNKTFAGEVRQPIAAVTDNDDLLRFLMAELNTVLI